MTIKDHILRMMSLVGRGRRLSSQDASSVLPDFVQDFVVAIAPDERLRNDFLHLAEAEPLRRSEILSSWLRARSLESETSFAVEKLCLYFAEEASFPVVARELETQRKRMSEGPGVEDFRIAS